MADLLVAGRSSLIGLHRIVRDADGERMGELAWLAAGRATRSAEIIAFPTRDDVRVSQPVLAGALCRFPVRSAMRAAGR